MKDKILSIIKELQPDVITTEEDLEKPFDEFGLDSLDVMEIIIKVETEFETNLDDCDITKANTINDLIKTVSEKR